MVYGAGKLIENLKLLYKSSLRSWGYCVVVE